MTKVKESVKKEKKKKRLTESRAFLVLCGFLYISVLTYTINYCIIKTVKEVRTTTETGKEKQYERTGTEPKPTDGIETELY